MCIRDRAYIVKMLAEVRALREGIIIADQLPTAMAPEVIKNTNIKLIHRPVSYTHLKVKCWQKNKAIWQHLIKTLRISVGFLRLRHLADDRCV